MAIRYVLDENLRGELWNAILTYNAQGAHLIDALRVGDPQDLPLKAPDPAILTWAEREARVLITNDKKSMPGHLNDHRKAGGHSPGIFLFAPKAQFPRSSLFSRPPPTPATLRNGPTSSRSSPDKALLPPRFMEMAKGCLFSPIVPCRLAGHGGTMTYRADRRAPCRSWNPLAIVFPDDMIGNFTAMVAGVAQSVEQRFCKP